MMTSSECYESWRERERDLLFGGGEYIVAGNESTGFKFQGETR